jgi:pimeloyl-ACP methyl ester carboxylesterase
MAFTTNNGVRLHWQSEGGGTPILLVMGHRYSSAMWYPVMPAFTAQHRVVRFDNRGTGQSDTTQRVSVQELADDAIAVMDAAAVEKAHIFGVSMGGVIVQDIAMRYPERVRSLIVGCSGMLTADKPRAPAIVRLFYRLPNGLLKLLFTPRGADKGYGSAAPADAIAFDMATSDADKFTKRGVIAQARAIANYRTSHEDVAKLTMPALVLHGDEDKLVPFKWGEELAQQLPNATFVRLEGAGHNFFIAQGEKANRAVLDFVRRVDESA